MIEMKPHEIGKWYQKYGERKLGNVLGYDCSRFLLRSGATNLLVHLFFSFSFALWWLLPGFQHIGTIDADRRASHVHLGILPAKEALHHGDASNVSKNTELEILGKTLGFHPP
jgi:hypothetical protein